MPLHLLPTADLEYTLTRDQDDPNPTVFVIKSLTVAERIKVGQPFIGITHEEIGARISQDFPLVMQVCETGIREIRGPGIPADHTPVQILNRVADPGVIVELLGAIFQHNFLTQEQEKNSVGLCTPAQPARSAAPAPTGTTGKRATRKRRSSGSTERLPPGSVR